MIKKYLWTFLYKRLGKYLKTDRLDYGLILNKYHRLFKIMTFSNLTYRQMVRIDLMLRSQNLSVLIDSTRVTYKTIDERIPYIENIPISKLSRKKVRLDRFLTDKNQVAIRLGNATEQLEEVIAHLSLSLHELRQSDPSEYSFYQNGISYLIKDLIEVMDMCMALELGVEDVTRHWRTVIRK